MCPVESMRFVNHLNFIVLTSNLFFFSFFDNSNVLAKAVTSSLAVISVAKRVPRTFHPLLSSSKQDYDRVGEAST